MNGNVVGCALKGLDSALEALAKEQRAQEKAATNKYQSKSKQTAAVQVTENGDGVTSVTVSLPSSKRASARTSRRGSISEGSGGQKFRSRRNSIGKKYALKVLNQFTLNKINPAAWSIISVAQFHEILLQK